MGCPRVDLVAVCMVLCASRVGCMKSMFSGLSIARLVYDEQRLAFLRIVIAPVRGDHVVAI